MYVVWGSTYLAIAIAVQSLPPLLSAGIRFTVAGALLGTWLVARRGRAALRVEPGRVGSAALVGVLLLAGANGLIMVAERTVPSGLTALVVASVPLWIVGLRIVAGDRIDISLLAGVLIGMAGVAILIVPRGVTAETDPLGLAAVVGATLSWSLGTFASPRLRMPRDPLVSTTLQMLAGGLLLIVVGIAVGELGRADPASFSGASLVALAYLVLFGSLVAFSAYTWLLQHASLSLVSTYAYVNPVVAVVLGSLVLREPITPSMLVGAATILAAVAFIVSRGATNRNVPARPSRNGPDL